MPEKTAQSAKTTQPKRKFALSTRLKIVVLDCLAVKLILQPLDGATPILTAIKKAKKSVDIAIFRFDRTDIEAELKAAAARGVKVTALIVYVNRGGEKHLRALEMRFLEPGIIVARTADDLARYHDKLAIFDRKTLFMLSLNFTHLDIDHSRGFGIITSNTKIVQEGIKLFEADCTRTPYTAGLETFVVSPVNSRKVLTTFLKRAKKQLLIYDPEISDPEVVRILQERAKAGVEIRIIGKASKRLGLKVVKLTKIRLHTRTILEDASQAFIGSQSLRESELDSLREVGLIIGEKKIVKQLTECFESDWSSTNAATDSAHVKGRAGGPQETCSTSDQGACQGIASFGSDGEEGRQESRG